MTSKYTEEQRPVITPATRSRQRRPWWLAVLVAARPKQWVKNLLVLAVPAAAGVLTEPHVLLDTALALVAFCLAAAGTYMLNDVADVEADRRHASKRLRPVATGELSTNTALACGIAAALLACGVAALVNIKLLSLVVAYVGLTTLYSVRLKHVPIFDIAAVASGFFLRAVAGGVAAELFISKWFLILSAGGSLFLVTGKRYAEMRGGAEEARQRRPVLAAYSEDYLRAMLSTTAGVVVTAYCIWCFEGREGQPASTWTTASAVPFVLGIMRYGLLVDSGHGEEPEVVLFGDKTLLGLGAACLGLLALGVVW
jgi:decaprenyl-phosphate phosphoribosyltransferase